MDQYLSVPRTMYVNVYFIMYIEEQYAVSDKIEVLLLAYLDGLYRSIWMQ